MTRVPQVEYHCCTVSCCCALRAGARDDQVSDEEGAVSRPVRRPREHVAGGARGEPHARHQLPRLAAQEELAERSLALREEYYGSTATSLLSTRA